MRCRGSPLRQRMSAPPIPPSSSPEPGPRRRTQAETTTEPIEKPSAKFDGVWSDRVESAWPDRYWQFVIGGLVLCLALSFIGFEAVRGNAPEFALALTYVVMP